VTSFARRSWNKRRTLRLYLPVDMFDLITTQNISMQFGIGGTTTNMRKFHSGPVKDTVCFTRSVPILSNSKRLF
jgi:hypothetical protein